MNKVKRAVDRFKKGFNCSQAVLGRNNKPSFSGRRGDDRHYKITKEQLEQLAPCAKKLHEVTERICKEKIGSFI